MAQFDCGRFGLDYSQGCLQMICEQSDSPGISVMTSNPSYMHAVLIVKCFIVKC